MLKTRSVPEEIMSGSMFIWFLETLLREKVSAASRGSIYIVEICLKFFCGATLSAMVLSKSYFLFLPCLMSSGLYLKIS